MEQIEKGYPEFVNVKGAAFIMGTTERMVRAIVYNLKTLTPYHPSPRQLMLATKEVISHPYRTQSQRTVTKERDALKEANVKRRQDRRAQVEAVAATKTPDSALKYVSQAEAAVILGISRQRVHQLTLDSYIPTITYDNVMVQLSDVLAYKVRHQLATKANRNREKLVEFLQTPLIPFTPRNMDRIDNSGWLQERMQGM